MARAVPRHPHSDAHHGLAPDAEPLAMLALL